MSLVRIVVLGGALLGCGVDAPRHPPAPTLAGDTEDGSTGDGSVDDPTTGISAGSDGTSTGIASTSGGSATASSTAATSTDTSPPHDGSSGGVSDSDDPSASASGDDSAGSTTDSSIPAALDPDLDIAESGQECATPGYSGDCPFLQVCRFFDTEVGHCETCDNCGNLNAPCSEGTDCDILFACFGGRCTNFCELGEQECGAPENCLDVGHPTRGVCDPFAW